jgi:hypothetical protein
VLRLIMQYALTLQFERNCQTGIADGRCNRGIDSCAHVLGYLEQAGDERGQEVIHLAGVCLQSRQLPLPVMQAPAHRRPDILVLGVGNSCKR